MKKKTLALLLSLTLIFTVGVVSTLATNHNQPKINVTLDGKDLSLGQQPVIENGRTLVPYRALAEKLGASVSYDGATKSVAVTKGSNVYVLTLNSKVATINGVEVSLDVPAQLMNNSTFVPLRFLSENLGIEVGYESATKTVSLKTKSAPSFSVYGVNQGDLLYTNQVKVSVVAFNHTLADFRTSMEVKEGQGHIHLWLDTDPDDPKLAYKLINGAPVIFDNVEPGDHTLTVQLVGNDHKPISPAIKQVIHFKTKSTTTTAEPKNYNISIQDFKYTPGTLTIPVGSTITFTNNDEVEHTVTEKDGSFDSDLFGNGETKKITFSKAGEYTIYCKPHTFMTAKIIVE